MKLIEKNTKTLNKIRICDSNYLTRCDIKNGY